MQLAVGVHHFRLEPKAELHAEPCHMLDQRFESIGINVLRRPPVAEPGLVITPRPEPAIIENEPLRANVSSLVREREELVRPWRGALGPVSDAFSLY